MHVEGLRLVQLADSSVAAGGPGRSESRGTDVRSIRCLDRCDYVCGTKRSWHREVGQKLGIRLNRSRDSDIAELSRTY